jgi:hypothetical protein
VEDKQCHQSGTSQEWYGRRSRVVGAAADCLSTGLTKELNIHRFAYPKTLCLFSGQRWRSRTLTPQCDLLTSPAKYRLSCRKQSAAGLKWGRGGSLGRQAHIESRDWGESSGILSCKQGIEGPYMILHEVLLQHFSSFYGLVDVAYRAQTARWSCTNEGRQTDKFRSNH